MDNFSFELEGLAGSDEVSATVVESFHRGSVNHKLESMAAPTIMEDLTFTLTQDTVTLQPTPAPLPTHWTTRSASKVQKTRPQLGGKSRLKRGKLREKNI